jgi:hypothetical protein
MLVVTVDKSGVALNSTISGVFTCKSRLDWVMVDQYATHLEVNPRSVTPISRRILIHSLLMFGDSYSINSDSLTKWSDRVSLAKSNWHLSFALTRRHRDTTYKLVSVTSKLFELVSRSFREGIQIYLESCSLYSTWRMFKTRPGECIEFH